MEASTHWTNIHIARRIAEVAYFIRTKLGTPDLALVLGSGLTGIKDELLNPNELLYEDIPNMPQATVKGHGRKLILGEIGNKKVLCWSGRVHGYQGYSPLDVSFIAYVSAFLGARAIILTNAAGGVDQSFHQGSIMMIKDYISWASGCPQYCTLKDTILGPRNMHGLPIFSPYLQELAVNVAKEMKLHLNEGNYCFTSGPIFETPHDIRVLRKFGAHSVGMSTVPEIQGARQLKLNVLAFSLITNMASGVTEKQIKHEEVFSTANQAGPQLQKYIRTIIEQADISQLSQPETPSRTQMISMNESQLNLENFPQDFMATRLNKQSINEASRFIKEKLDLTKQRKLVVICAPLQETCKRLQILKELPISAIPKFPQFSKSAFTSRLVTIPSEDALLLLCPRQEFFHETESYAIVEIFRAIGIFHYNILIPAQALSAKQDQGVIEEICDYTDRNYSTALTKTRIKVINPGQGKNLVAYQGPMYPTKTQKAILGEALNFDYYCVSNLSLVAEIDRTIKLTKSLYVVSHNLEAPGFKFSELTLSDEVIDQIVSVSKSQYELIKTPSITKNFKFKGPLQILVPDFTEVCKIKEAAEMLALNLENQAYKNSVLIVNSDFLEALTHNVNIINSIDFVYESGIKAHLLVAQVKDVEFLVLLNDCQDRAGELSLDTVTTPIRVLKLAGITNFIFLTTFFTPIKEIRGKIWLYKDRMLWNMKNSLIGKNEEKWGERFVDLSRQIDANLCTQFKEIWKKQTGEDLKQLIGLWENNSKPYYGACEIKAMEVLGCQGFIKNPVNQISIVAHMEGRALCILFPLKEYEECHFDSTPIGKLFTEALPELFLVLK